MTLKGLGKLTNKRILKRRTFKRLSQKKMKVGKSILKGCGGDLDGIVQ